MFNKKDYPAFSDFMEMLPVLYDCVDDPDYKLAKSNDIFTQFAKYAGEEWGDEYIRELKKDILKIKAKNIDNSDMQIILAQQYKVKFRQKEIPVIFDNILKGIDCRDQAALL